MYLPPKFKNENQAEILEIMRKYPLATVISSSDGGSQPMISHLPLVVDFAQSSTRKDLVLLGHLARANPHCKLFRGSEVTAIFHGPNTYITPQWYVENNVPTWNYAVVHIQGQVELIEEQSGIIDCLKKLTAHAEAGSNDPWEFWIPEDLSSATDLCSAIVGFRIVVNDIQAKFKLSQNRSDADRKGVLKGLGSRTDEMSREVARLMEQQNTDPTRVSGL